MWNASAVTSATFAVKVGSTATVGTITTSFGSTGTSYAGGIGYAFIIWARVTGTGSLTLTVSTSAGSGNYLNVACDEFSGVHATPLDVDGGEAVISGTTTPTDTITTLTANDLIIGVIVPGSGSGETITPGTGYTQIAEDETPTIQLYNAMFQIVTTATTYNVDWTISSSLTNDIIDVAFKESTAAAARQRCIGCGTDKKVIGE